MWKLNTVGASVLYQYAKELLPDLKERIKNGVKSGSFTLCPNDIKVLIPDYGTPSEDDSVLLDLLTLEPKELEKHCTNLMSAIIQGYNVNEFQIYLENFQKKNLTGIEKGIVDKYKDKLTALENIFDYEGQISHNADRSYWLARMKGTNACTYCNRQYTFTIEEYESSNKTEHIARPELDHWFCKQLFPLMSLSFYNLIPCCHTCNSSVKSNTIFSLSTHVHPYLQQDGNPKIHFQQKLTSLGWSVVIKRKKGSREDRMVEDFKLNEIYRYHGPLEVKDLIEFNSSFSPGYLSLLYKKVLKEAYGNKSQSEVYRMLFGTEYNPNDFGARPLSKLKYDILKNLKVI